MSLAYKLWKIGQTLSADDVWDAMSDSGEHPGDSDPQYINIEFTISGDKVAGIDLKKNSISRDKLFFCQKNWRHQ